MFDMMVLDDDPIVRVTLTAALRDEGFRAVEASDGAEALDLLRDNAGIRVLVTDIRLGGSPNGLAVAAEAMRLLPDLQVIYMTGRPETLSGIRMTRRQRILAKPFMPSYLVEIAHDMIGQAALC